MTKQEKKREYNRRYREKHPEITKKNNAYIKKRYFEDDKFREEAKYCQKKSYWKRQGYYYESYDMPDAWNVLEHLKDYIYSADEVKITNQNGYYLFEVKTKIKSR